MKKQDSSWKDRKQGEVKSDDAEATLGGDDCYIGRLHESKSDSKPESLIYIDSGIHVLTHS
jgi:hypothetical protein